MQKKFDFEPSMFDMSMIDENMKIVFIGKSNTGKSTIILDYLYHHTDVPVTVISPVDKYYDIFSPHIPFIHDEYSPELLENILNKQKIIKEKECPQYANVDPRNIIILDDCITDDELRKDKCIKSLFYNESDTTIILKTLTTTSLPRNLRSKFQWAFLCRDNRIKEQEEMYKNFASIFPTFEMFRQVHDKYTEDYGCLVINLSSTSTDLSENVFCYRVDIENRLDWNTFRLCNYTIN